MNTNLKNHRYDITFLRAISVIFVILFHSEFEIFKWGYVGVDIFFVISGYLIFKILDQNTSNVIDFYDRRIRRIFPVLLSVIIVILIFSLFNGIPYQQILIAESSISAIFFASNFYYDSINQNYFLNNLNVLNENPLLHLWSLSIELQFYLIFPIIFFFFKKKNNLLIFFLIIFVSFTIFLSQWGGNLSFYYPYFEKKFIFFSPPNWLSFYSSLTRIGEISLGVLAYSIERKRKINSNIFLILGFLLIFITPIIFNYFSNHPGIQTLIPTIGTLLILTNIGKTYNFLKNPFLINIGLLSYSLYLWHYLVFYFYKMSINENLTLKSFLFCSIVSYFISYLSFIFIEKPFRNRAKISGKNFLIIIFSVLLIIISTSFLIITNKGFAGKFSKAENEVLTPLFSRVQYVSQNFNEVAINQKTKKAPFDDFDAIIIGDSYAQDFYNIIVSNNFFKDYKFISSAIPARCPMYLGKKEYESYDLICDEYLNMKSLKKFMNKSKLVILAASWTEWEAENILETIKNLEIKKNQKLILVGTKGINFNASEISNIKKLRSLENLNKFKLPIPDNKMKINETMKRNLKSFHFIDLYEAFCEEECNLFTKNDNLIYYDEGHLTESSMKDLGDLLMKNDNFISLSN